MLKLMGPSMAKRHALALNDKDLVWLHYCATTDKDTNQVSIQVLDLPIKAQKGF
jgi:hypothetical protein